MVEEALSSLQQRRCGVGGRDGSVEEEEAATGTSRRAATAALDGPRQAAGDEPRRRVARSRDGRLKTGRNGGAWRVATSGGR